MFSDLPWGPECGPFPGCRKVRVVQKQLVQLCLRPRANSNEVRLYLRWQRRCGNKPVQVCACGVGVCVCLQCKRVSHFGQSQCEEFQSSKQEQWNFFNKKKIPIKNWTRQNEENHFLECHSNTLPFNRGLPNKPQESILLSPPSHTHTTTATATATTHNTHPHRLSFPRAKLLRFIWQTQNDEANWTWKSGSFSRLSSKSTRSFVLWFSWPRIGTLKKVAADVILPPAVSLTLGWCSVLFFKVRWNVKGKKGDFFWRSPQVKINNRGQTGTKGNNSFFLSKKIKTKWKRQWVNMVKEKTVKRV